MSDAEPSPPPARPAVNLVRMALIALALSVAAGAAFGLVYFQNPTPPPVDVAAALKTYLSEQGRYLKMADGYADADGDLVADAPTDPAKFLEPDELAFTVVASDDPAAAEKSWRPFLDHLQKATGVKAVTYLKDLGPPAAPAAKGEKPADDGPPPAPAAGTVEQQLDALKAGRLHVTAFNTGFVPAAVNTAGFVPLFCPADAAGKFGYEMEVLVPAGSPAKTVTDLRGKTLAFVAMSSNSGAKAPLVLFKQKFDMLPGRDYEFVVSGTQERSIEGVAAGRYAAAPVANDLVQRTAEAGKVKADGYRSVYTSDPFPPITFGVPHDLDPKLRAGVVKAFETFAFEGTAVGRLYASPKREKFARVDYKKDFGFVREIDEALAAMAGGK